MNTIQRLINRAKITKQNQQEKKIEKQQAELEHQQLVEFYRSLNDTEYLVSRKAFDHGLPISSSALNRVNGIYRDVTEFNMITIEDEMTARNVHFSDYKAPVFDKKTYDFLQDVVSSSLPNEYRLVWQEEPLYINNHTFKFVIEPTASMRLKVDTHV